MEINMIQSYDYMVMFIRLYNFSAFIQGPCNAEPNHPLINRIVFSKHIFI